MMGFDPMSLEYIRLAHEDGLGVGDPRDIEIVGDVDAAQENWRFHVGKNLVRVGGGDLIWFGPLKRFQKLFFHTPLVNGFILASEVYHDFYRWPLVDRRVFERWCETTEWGQMFLRYARDGAARAPTAARRPLETTVPTSPNSLTSRSAEGGAPVADLRAQDRHEYVAPRTRRRCRLGRRRALRRRHATVHDSGGPTLADRRHWQAG